MRPLFSAALTAMTILFVSGSSATSPVSEKSDREEITALLAALDQTWNEHDMRAHAALFHVDGIWIAWTGEVIKGRAAYEAELTPLHKTVFRNSVHKGWIEELEFVAPDVAIVRGYGTVIGNEPTPEKTHRYRNLIVMTKRDGAWKISWGQKTRFADRTPDPSPEK